MPAQNGLPTPPEQHLPHPGIRTLQPDFSRDATPQTPPEDPSPGHPASAGTNPPGNRVHQTAEESFHSRATCENPGAYCRIGFSYKSLRQGPPPPGPLSPSARNQRHKVTDTLSMKFLIVTGESGDIRSDSLSLNASRARVEHPKTPKIKGLGAFCLLAPKGRKCPAPGGKAPNFSARVKGAGMWGQ